jgi:eukaryotic-like serine/threonine-protein kinase
MIGRTLEHYRIESKLGEGGMGVVYKGHDPRLDRWVAIKVLPPEKLGDPAGQQRFLREARAASALNHPGIVTIHDIRSHDGVEFIVMEFIEGKTLAELIPPGGLPEPHLLRLAVQMADALDAAHQAGILHRDLKPSNIMVTPQGRIKVLDFGLAKLIERPKAAPGATTATAQLTAAQVVVGTAPYMSPEQAEGRRVDARSDVFSFGSMLYEMATGQRPFHGESWLSLLGRILNDEPKPPHDVEPSVSRSLESAILRCLRKDPASRFQTMADVRSALEDVTAQSAIVHEPEIPHDARWRLWPAVGAVAIIILLAAVGYYGWRAVQHVPQSAPLRVETLTTFPGRELYPSFSPDGNYVVFTWNGPRQDNTDVYVQQIGAGSPLQLTSDPTADYNPVWSPDGKWVAFLRGNPARPLSPNDREVRLIPPLKGPERKLADIRVQEITVNPAYLTWCPDSTCVVVSDTTGDGKPVALFVISIESGEKRQLTTPAAPAIADTNPAISEDGRTLLFLRRTTWAMGEVFLQPLKGDMTAAGDARPLATPGLKPDSATWMPNGSEILVSSGAISGGANLWRVSVRGDSPPSRLPFAGEDGVLPTVSRSQPGRPSRLVYVRSFTDDNIWRIDVPGVGAPASEPPVVAVASTKADIHPQLSPDGRRVAFTSTRSGWWEIWIADPDGANAVQLTNLRAPTGTGVPHWSPDGTTIVFASDAEGQFDLFLTPAAGGKPRNITSHAAFDHVPVFSRDGHWIYFSSTRSGQYQVWKLPVAGGPPVQVTTDGGWLSQESVDGRDLYFSPPPAVGGSAPVWRMSTTGGTPVKVVDGVFNHQSAIVQRGIYYLERQGTQTRLQFYDAATRRTTTIARNLGEASPGGGFAVSADGRTIFYARTDSSIDDLMLVDNIQ